jgi:hypothetical protein
MPAFVPPQGMCSYPAPELRFHHRGIDMFRAFGVGLLLLVASSGGAAAQGVCGDNPIAPEIAAPADILQKSPADAAAAKHATFQDIKRWQGALKSYRDCINASISADNRKIGEAQRADKPDPDKIKGLQLDIQNASKAYQASTDNEERIVNDWNAMSTAYCTRTDVDKTSCPKR